MLAVSVVLAGPLLTELAPAVSDEAVDFFDEPPQADVNRSALTPSAAVTNVDLRPVVERNIRSTFRWFVRAGPTGSSAARWPPKWFHRG